MKLHNLLLFVFSFLFSISGFGQTIIYSEDFTGQDGKGATGDDTNGGTTTTDLTGIDWTIEVGGTLETDGSTNTFQVETDEAFAGIDVDGSAFWFSPTIDVTTIDDVDIEVDLEIIADGANSTGENLTVYYTLNPNASNPTYTTIESYDENNDSNLPLTLTETNIDVSSTNNFGIRVEIYADGAGDGFSFDNLEVTGTQTCSGEPTAQSTNITFSNTNASSIDVSWTAGTGGSDYILVAREANDVSFTPTDGTDYSADTASGDFSSATDQGSGNKVVFSGIGTSTTVTNLNSSTTYHFQVFYFCSASNDYLTSIGTGNDGTQTQATSATPVTIVQQDFDSGTPTWNYSNDVSFFDNGWGSGFYGIIEASSASPLNNANFSGNILG